MKGPPRTCHSKILGGTTIWFRGTVEQSQAVDRLAQLEGVSRAEVLRRALEFYDCATIGERAEVLAIRRAAGTK